MQTQADLGHQLANPPRQQNICEQYQRGMLASLVPDTEGVTGSIPVAPTTFQGLSGYIGQDRRPILARNGQFCPLISPGVGQNLAKVVALSQAGNRLGHVLGADRRVFLDHAQSRPAAQSHQRVEVGARHHHPGGPMMPPIVHPEFFDAGFLAGGLVRGLKRVAPFAVRVLIGFPAAGEEHRATERPAALAPDQVKLDADAPVHRDSPWPGGLGPGDEDCPA